MFWSHTFEILELRFGLLKDKQIKLSSQNLKTEIYLRTFLTCKGEINIISDNQMGKESRRALVLGGPEGHRSLADTFTHYSAEEGCDVIRKDIVNQSFFWEAYRIFYRFTPHLFGLLFKLGGLPLIEATIEAYTTLRYGPQIREVLRSAQPELVITTHWGYLRTLEKALEEGELNKWVNVVPDPRGVHPLTVSPGAINTAFDSETAQIIERYGVPPEQIEIIGWPVRRAFLKEFDENKIREKLGFSKDLPTWFVCGGSEGSNKVKRLVKILAEVNPQIQLIIVAGNNHQLEEWAREKRTALSRAKVKITGFVSAEEMAQFLSISDLAFIKAGPNSIFEAVLQGVPLVIISHISGQEDGNLEVVKNYNLGIIAEKQDELKELVLNLLDRETLTFSLKANQLKEDLSETPNKIRQLLRSLNQ